MSGIWGVGGKTVYWISVLKFSGRSTLEDREGDWKINYGIIIPPVN
jgi:hypothetical protein